MKNAVLIPLVVAAALTMLVFAGIFGASLRDFDESVEPARGSAAGFNGVAEAQGGTALSQDENVGGPLDSSEVLARAETLAGALPRPNGIPAGMAAPDPAYADDLDQGVRQVDNSIRQLPGLVAHVASQVGRHGLAGMLYEDPELKRLGRETGKELGSGIRHLVDVVGKDMVAAAKANR